MATHAADSIETLGREGGRTLAAQRNDAGGAADAVSIASLPSVAEFDLHGAVGVRCLNASAHDLANLQRQLGVPAYPAGHCLDPQITIRFVEKLSLKEELQFVQAGESAASDGKLVLFPRRGAGQPRVQIPLGEVGGHCEIVGERGVGRLPLLNSTVNLTALANGMVPLHASAVCWQGQGLLASGWTGGGKTGLMLAMTALGGQFVGDDLLFATVRGEQLHGFAQPIRIKQSYLDQLPALRSKVSPSDRNRLRLLRFLHWGVDCFNRLAPRSWLAGLRSKTIRALTARQAVELSPQELCGDNVQLSSTLDRILVVVGNAGRTTYSRPASPGEIAGRLFATSRSEFQDLIDVYYQNRFAFPECRNPRIESLDRDLEMRIHQLVQNKPGTIVYHPLPASLTGFQEVVRQVVGVEEGVR